MCAQQRHMLLLYEEQRNMDSVHSRATIQEMLKLSPEVRHIVLDMYEQGLLETLAEKQGEAAEHNEEEEKYKDKHNDQHNHDEHKKEEEQYNNTDAEKLSA